MPGGGLGARGANLVWSIRWASQRKAENGCAASAAVYRLHPRFTLTVTRTAVHTVRLSGHTHVNASFRVTGSFSHSPPKPSLRKADRSRLVTARPILVIAHVPCVSRSRASWLLLCVLWSGLPDRCSQEGMGCKGRWGRRGTSTHWK